MRYLAYVAYEGTAFEGWQRQSRTLNTIQGTIENFLSQYLGRKTSIHGAGRTDSGVHAKRMAFHFDSPRPLNEKAFLRYAIKGLPQSIGIHSLEKVDDTFDARLHVSTKTYCYYLAYDVDRDPFRANHEYQLFDDRFDLARFEWAIMQYKGEHDFRCFTSKEEDKDGYIRDIANVYICHHEKGRLEVRFSAHGFMRYMVRMMVGAAIAYATSTIDREHWQALLAHKTDKLAPLAPPQGLFLEEVIY